MKAIDNSFLIAIEVLDKVLSVTKPFSVSDTGSRPTNVLAALKFATDLETFPSIVVLYCMPHCPLLQRPVKDHSVL